MFVTASVHNEHTIFYIDAAGNRFVASGGSLAWRLNNPGLLRAPQKGAIGKAGPYAIFPSRQAGRHALGTWISSKRVRRQKLLSLEKSAALEEMTGISLKTKLGTLDDLQLAHLLVSIEHVHDQTSGTLRRLPKILAKIDQGDAKAYLLEDQTLISKEEAIAWAQTERLDAQVIEGKEGTQHLRSRHPVHRLPLPGTKHRGKIRSLVRSVGTRREGQCLWAFINGINNTKQGALETAKAISALAQGEQMLCMPNDTRGMLRDFVTCCLLKASMNVPVIAWAVQFFRYLLHLEANENYGPPIVFVHSQGAIITRLALELLKPKERKRLRIFAFGGGSYIPPNLSHSESHNYASAGDFVCLFASPQLQLLALERYYGMQQGLSEKEIVEQLAWDEALRGGVSPMNMKAVVKQRETQLKKAFREIQNLTILDPDPGTAWQHAFDSKCYQDTLKSLVQRYRTH